MEESSKIVRRKCLRYLISPAVELLRKHLIFTLTIISVNCHKLVSSGSVNNEAGNNLVS